MHPTLIVSMMHWLNILRGLLLEF